MKRTYKSLRRCFFGCKGRGSRRNQSHVNSSWGSCGVGCLNQHFFDYSLRLSFFDVVLLRRLHHLKSIGVPSAQLPASVQCCLQLGEKFVPDTTFCMREFDSALSQLSLRLRRKYFFAHNECRRRPCENHILPQCSLRSAFFPKLPPDVESILQKWIRGIREDALNMAASHKRVRQPYIIRKAVAWLKAQHQSKSLCRIGSDKGYGPMVCSFDTVLKQTRSEATSGDFLLCSQDILVSQYIDIFDSLDAILDKGVSFSYTTRSTKVYVATIPCSWLTMPQGARR